MDINLEQIPSQIGTAILDLDGKVISVRLALCSVYFFPL
jgi:hypothetical protein